MKPFEECAICGGRLAKKMVEKILRGGNHTAILRVSADVCLHCGERLYSQKVVRRFEEIRKKLSSGRVGKFQHLGKSFQIA